MIKTLGKTIVVDESKKLVIANNENKINENILFNLEILSWMDIKRIRDS